jgi:mannitol/fructose-specific phosphotransferase system IIA component (Ntr-type)
MKLTDYLTSKNIKIGIKGRDKEEIIEELIGIAESVAPGLNRGEAVGGLMKRESIGSTGVGKGVAIPHTGVKNCSKILPVIALAEEGVNYESLDGDPVRLFFMILYPENQIRMQLKFLARVSRLLRNEELRNSLLECSTPEEMMDVLTAYELEHFS